MIKTSVQIEKQFVITPISDKHSMALTGTVAEGAKAQHTTNPPLHCMLSRCLAPSPLPAGLGKRAGRCRSTSPGPARQRKRPRKQKTRHIIANLLWPFGCQTKDEKRVESGMELKLIWKLWCCASNSPLALGRAKHGGGRLGGRLLHYRGVSRRL